MGFLRDYLSTVKKAYRGELRADPSQLTPEQRARYEEQMARADAEMAAARERNLEWQQKVSDDSVLYGPALRFDDTDWAAEVQRRGGLDVAKDLMRQRAGEFAGAVAESVGSPPEPDPAAAAAELAARAAARAPYRAPRPPQVAITRIATRGATQLQELVAHLQASGLAARPDMVHGVYRVPDRISPNLTPHSEKGRVVEWAVVHHPGALAPAPETVLAPVFARDAQLLARRLGEPAVLDEEVAALYCGFAGVAAEQCLGFARLPGFHAPATDSADHADVVARVAGVAVLHRPVAGATAGRERFERQAPLRDPIPLLHHEVLDWEAIRERVQPERRHAAAAPSPLPHLPSTPEELLLAYLEVVGVQPGDGYGAQVTISTPRRHSFAGSFADPLGPQHPTADGKPRRRLHAAEHVVVSYRDRPEYEAGRERWARYQHEVLFARLDHLSAKRPVLRDDRPGALDRLAGAVDVIVDPLWALDALLERRDAPSPFPYCWPPVR